MCSLCGSEKADRSEGRRVFVHTFGCQMNVHDSERILGLLAAEGYVPVPNARDADIVLLNTCSVRQKPEHKVLSAVGRYALLSRRGRRPVIGIGGCFARQEGERLLRAHRTIDFVFGPDNIQELPSTIQRFVLDGERVADVEFDPPDLTRFLDVRPVLTSSPVTGFVTAMKGCDNFCSYCIVPLVRGRERSRPPGEIVRECRGLAEAGVREVTVLGQSVTGYRWRAGSAGGAWGGGTPGGPGGEGEVPFHALLEMIGQVEGLERIRFTSPHPRGFTRQLIDSFGVLPQLCEYVHLPFQSGSDAVLQRMNRRHGREEYLELVAALRSRVPEMGLTADVIVGFPGETEEDFEQTMELVRRVRFDGLFSFKYSVRPGTKAARWKDDVPEEVKKRRLEILQVEQRALTREKHCSMVGRQVEVLVEGRSKKDESWLTGRTRCNRTANFPGAPDLVGELVQVEVTEGYQNSLAARQVGPLAGSDEPGLENSDPSS